MQPRSGFAPRIGTEYSNAAQHESPLAGALESLVKRGGVVLGFHFQVLRLKGFFASAAPRAFAGNSGERGIGCYRGIGLRQQRGAAKEARLTDRLPGKCGSIGHILKANLVHSRMARFAHRRALRGD